LRRPPLGVAFGVSGPLIPSFFRRGLVVSRRVASAVSAGGVRASETTDDVRRICGRGNAPTEAATVQDFVLLEAAETTLAAGGTQFVIVGRKTSAGRGRAGRPGSMPSAAPAGARAAGRRRTGSASRGSRPTCRRART